MTNHDPINQAYQARKRRHRAPASSKSLLMARAQKHANAANSGSNLWNWSLGAVAASGLVILYQLVSWPQGLIEHDQVVSNMIEIHQIADENVSLQEPLLARQQAIALEYQAVQQEFSERQQTLVAHHMREAVLLSTEHGLRLQTCDNTLLVISPALTQALQQQYRLEFGEQDKHVAISFDQSGRIISIYPSDHRCT